jgi:hypothetical protein
MVSSNDSPFSHFPRLRQNDPLPPGASGRRHHRPLLSTHLKLGEPGEARASESGEQPKQLETNSRKPQTADREPQTANQQPTADSRQPTADNQKPQANSQG